MKYTTIVLKPSDKVKASVEKYLKGYNTEAKMETLTMSTLSNKLESLGLQAFVAKDMFTAALAVVIDENPDNEKLKTAYNDYVNSNSQ